MNFGAIINDSDNEKNSVLHQAAKQGQPEVVQCLLKYGANPYTHNIHGYVPLDIVHEDMKESFQICGYCRKFGSLVCKTCEIVHYCSNLC